MNGTRGLVIATAAAFIVGCSVGLMGGILFMRFATPAPPWVAMRDGRRMEGPRSFERRVGGEPRRRGPGARRGPAREDHMMLMLEQELDLSAAQRERIVAQLDRARRAHAAVRDSVQVWIDHELTPAQREKWKQMEARFEEEKRARGMRRVTVPNRP